MNSENPYQAPTYEAESRLHPEGVWREGDLVVLSKGGSLPARCIRCNAAEGVKPLLRQPTWHHPMLYLLIFVPGPAIYIIVALIVQQKAKFYIGLCRTHRNARYRDMAIAAALILSTIPLLLVGVQFAWPIWVTTTVCLGAVVAGAIYGQYRASIVLPQKIDHHYAWLKGAGREYLDALPLGPDGAVMMAEIVAERR